jgi:hypothetical protein
LFSVSRQKLTRIAIPVLDVSRKTG